MDANERLERIAQFVHDRLEEMGPDQQERPGAARYRWLHTLRVANYGRTLAEAEGAPVELAIAGCLLHDVASFDPGDPQDHGRRGAEISRPLLRSLGYSEEEVEAVCYAVACHVDVENPESLLAEVVSDADNIDRFGAYRILLWCWDDIDDLEALADRLSQRVPRLEDYRRRGVLGTATGNAMFNRQLDLQIAVFSTIVQEKELSVLPRL